MALLQDTLVCPHCETRNAEEAVVCHFCGGDLPKPAAMGNVPAEKDDNRILPTVPMVHQGVVAWFMREGNCCLVLLVVLLLPWAYWLVMMTLAR